MTSTAPAPPAASTPRRRRRRSPCPRWRCRRRRRSSSSRPSCWAWWMSSTLSCVPVAARRRGDTVVGAGGTVVGGCRRRRSWRRRGRGLRVVDVDDLDELLASRHVQRHVVDRLRRLVADGGTSTRGAGYSPCGSPSIQASSSPLSQTWMAGNVSSRPGTSGAMKETGKAPSVSAGSGPPDHSRTVLPAPSGVLLAVQPSTGSATAPSIGALMRTCTVGESPHPCVGLSVIVDWLFAGTATRSGSVCADAGEDTSSTPSAAVAAIHRIPQGTGRTVRPMVATRSISSWSAWARGHDRQPSSPPGSVPRRRRRAEPRRRGLPVDRMRAVEGADRRRKGRPPPPPRRSVRAAAQRRTDRHSPPSGAVRAVRDEIAAGDDDPERFRAMGIDVVIGEASVSAPNEVTITAADGATRTRVGAHDPAVHGQSADRARDRRPAGRRLPDQRDDLRARARCPGGSCSSVADRWPSSWPRPATGWASP